jgi:hypothetical protein
MGDKPIGKETVQNSGGVTGKGWVKGQSGNPGGRAKGIGALARQHTDRALEVLVNALDDDDARVRVAASKEILDRGYGKAIAMTADVSNKLDAFDDDAIESAIDVLRAAVNSASTADQGERRKTTH